MARRKNNPVSATPTRPTAQEMSMRYAQSLEKTVNFAKAEGALKILDNIQKTRTNTISAFDKKKLRTYLQNIGSNENNLRQLSRYLYYRSQPYKRLIWYNANMFDLDCRSIIPGDFDMVKNPNPKKLLKSINETANILDRMNLNYEFRKVATTCMIEDVFYGCAYYDETGFFILPLDPQYCKIAGYYQTGDFVFYMNMSYFVRNAELLELWGEPFQSMYREYEKDTTNNKWVQMPDEYAVCIKADPHNWQTIVPPYSGLLNEVISMIDLEDIQAIADKQDILKLVVMEMETQDGAKESDQWKVDPEMYIEYFDRLLNDCLPEYVAGAIAPGKLTTINFGESDRINDVNKMAKATSAFFNTSGGAQILNSATISGTEAFKAAIQSDTQTAIGFMLPQIQAWINRWLSYQTSTPCKVKLFPVSVYTKESYKESLRQDAQNSMPVKLALNTFNGFSEKDTLALLYLEEDILHLNQRLTPLQSSHTTANVNPAENKALGNGGDASANTSANGNTEANGGNE